MSLENKALSVIYEVGYEISSIPFLRFRNRYLSSLQLLLIKEAKFANEILSKTDVVERKIFVERELFSISKFPILITKLRNFFINNRFILSRRFFSSSIMNLIDLYLKKYVDFDRDLVKRDVAILYADMAGFSIKVARNDKLAVMTTLLYFQTFMKIIEKYNGIGEISGGDTILCILPTPVSAISAAIEIYCAFKEMNKKTVENIKRIIVRIGLSYGNIFTNKDGKPFISHHINIAQRVSDKGGKGRVVRTQCQHDRDIAEKKWKKEKWIYLNEDGIWVTDTLFRAIDKPFLFGKRTWWSELIKGAGIDKFRKVKARLGTLKKLSLYT